MDKVNRLLSITICAVLMASSQAGARTLYKWVDEHGVTHYSEFEPANGKESEELILPDSYASTNFEEDYYSIQNQLERVQQQRRDLLERRLLRQTALQSQRPAPPIVQTVVQESQPVYRSFFPLGGFHLSPKFHACGVDQPCGGYHFPVSKYQSEPKTVPRRSTAFRNVSKN